VGYFCGDMKRIMDDVGAFHPTVFCGVPRVLDRVYTGVLDKVGAAERARGVEQQPWRPLVTNRNVTRHACVCANPHSWNMCT